MSHSMVWRAVLPSAAQTPVRGEYPRQHQSQPRRQLGPVVRYGETRETGSSGRSAERAQVPNLSLRSKTAKSPATPRLGFSLGRMVSPAFHRCSLLLIACPVPMLSGSTNRSLGSCACSASGAMVLSASLQRFLLPFPHLNSRLNAISRSRAEVRASTEAMKARASRVAASSSR